MDRMRRLAQLWSWLPAFRVVGETEHLPTAAKQLAVSASALSRSVRLLEDAVGQPLFDRLPRRLSLNEAGARLLSSMRHAMRQLDEGLQAISGGRLTGPLRLSTTASTAALLVVPAMVSLQQRYPGLTPEINALSTERAFESLLRGKLDVALIEERAELPDELACELLLPVTYGVYCGEAHPLFAVENITREAMAEHAFVGPPAGIDDGWPPQIERVVGFRVWSYHLAVELCREGRYLASLPDRCVELIPASRGPLRRLPLELDSRGEVYAVYRRSLDEDAGAGSGEPGRVDVALAALRAVATAEQGAAG